MAIPKLKKQDVIDALKFIDENGVPEHNTSVKYVLVSEDGKKYPPKYVVAVADHLANSTDIFTSISVVTCPFRPILVMDAGLIPTFSHRSFFFMSLSMSSFQSFL